MHRLIRCSAMKNIKQFRLSRLSLSTYLLTISMLADAAFLTSPYPDAPYHLVGEIKTIVGDGAKPNVVVLYDNSASMKYVAPGYPKKSKVIYESDYPINRNRATRKLIRQFNILEPANTAGTYYTDAQGNQQYEPSWKVWEVKEVKDFNKEEARKARRDKKYKQREREMVDEKLTKSRHQVVIQGLAEVTAKYHDRARWTIWPLNEEGKFNKIKKGTPGFLMMPDDYYETQSLYGAFLGLTQIELGGTSKVLKEYLDEVVPFLQEKMAFRCQKNHVIVITDGETYGSPNYRNDSELKRLLGVESGLIPADNLKLAQLIGSSLAKRDLIGDAINVFDAKNKPKYTLRFDQAGHRFDGVQTIETHTIGVGKAMEEKGEKSKARLILDGLATSGQAYALVSNERDEFKDVFEKIVGNFQASVSTSYFDANTSSPEILSQATGNAVASTSIDTKSWSSEIKFFNVDKNGNVDKSTTFYPNYAPRKLMVSYLAPDGSTKYNFSTDANLPLHNSFFGIFASSNEWKDALLPWFARSKSDEEIQRIGGEKYRIRNTAEKGIVKNTRHLGDILDSPLVEQQSTASNNSYLVTAANDGLLYVYKHNKGEDATKYDLLFNYLPLSMQRESNTDSDTVAHYLQVVSNKAYGNSIITEGSKTAEQKEAEDKYKHIRLFNGGISTREIVTAGKHRKQTIAASSLGQGGRGAFALSLAGHNLSDGKVTGLEQEHESWRKSVPLLETDKGVTNKLGYTVSTPQIARVSLSPNGSTESPDRDAYTYYAMVLSSGFDYKTDFVKGITPKSNAALYIYDLVGTDVGLNPNASNNDIDEITKNQGKLIRKIEVSNATGGLASPILVDTDLDGIADVAYAGDYGGSMYRFDLRGGKPELWSVTKIFSGNIDKPITAAPVVMRQSPKKEDNGKVIVMFGTGSELYAKDYIKTNIQSMYGIYDDINEYISDIDLGTSTSSDASQSENTPETGSSDASGSESVHVLRPLSDQSSGNELLVQTIDTEETYRVVSNNPFKKGQHRGWRLDLVKKNGRAIGERVTWQPTLHYNTVIFTTKTYAQLKNQETLDPCAQSRTGVRNVSPGWVMTLNAENGGALTKENARVDFDGKGTIYNGIRFRAFVNYTILYTNQNMHNLSRNQDGMYLNSGSDADILKDTTPDHQAYKTCGTVKDNIIMRDYDGVFVTNKLLPPQCKNSHSLKRLSWRDLTN